MPCLRKLLAGLMLFCVSAAYSIATKKQVKEGQVEGFTGLSDVEPKSDWLTATFCYCHYPEQIDEYSGLLHWYQIEYYSIHYNKTFILPSNCPWHYKEANVQCVPPPGPDVLAGDTVGDELCKTWPGREETTDDKRLHDNVLCYKPFEENGDDYIEFNGQQRNLSPHGGQLPQRQDQKVVDQVCGGMCHDYLNATLLIHPHKMPSHQVVWIDLDDMCDTCR